MRLVVEVTCILLIACGSAAGAPEPKVASFVQIESLTELDRVLKNMGGKPTLLRVRADWDISDAEMDKHFASESLQQLLAGVVLLEIDVTDNTEEHRKFLSKYEVFGPPWILFFDKSGKHIAGKDIAGYETQIRLEERIRNALEE